MSAVLEDVIREPAAATVTEPRGPRLAILAVVSTVVAALITIALALTRLDKPLFPAEVVAGLTWRYNARSFRSSTRISRSRK